MAYPYGGVYAVSLGTAAGSTLQGPAAIAIGYQAGVISQPASSIIINATGSSLLGVAPNALYIAPIRNLISGSLLMYDTVNKEVVYSSTLNTTFTANNIIALSTLSASTVSFSTVVLNTATVSTANVQNMNYSTLSGSTITANTQNVSTTNVQFLNYSTLSGSTITANTQNVSTTNVQFLNYSTLSGSTITTNTENVSTSNVQFLNYSTLSGSTITTNTAKVSTLNVQFINYSSLLGSTITTNSGFVNSTLTVSTLIAANINVSSLTLNLFSTLTGSSIIASTLAISTITTNTGFVNSTLTVSTLIAANINVSSLTLNLFSTLTGSSLIASTVAISTITANTGFITSTLTVSTLIAANINVSSLALNQFSTLTGSSLIASTVAISTITANTGFITSTLTVSTLIAANINVSSLALNQFSTLTGSSLIASTVAISTITANTGFITSTLTVSTLIAANINVSSLALNQFSTLTGSSLIASTVAISTITTNTGFVNSTLTVSTLIGSTINSQFINYSTLSGSTISSNVLYSNLLFFSSISSINGTFGITGPTGPIGQASQVSYLAPGTQTMAPSASLAIVNLVSTPEIAQSIGITGFAYNPLTYLFMNNTPNTIPISVSYSIALNTTAGGYAAVGLTISGTTTYYSGMYTASNGFSNSTNIIVPPLATVGLYYMDNATVVIQSATRFTLAQLQVGQQGATGLSGSTGPTGPQGQASQLSYIAPGTQSMPPSGSLAIVNLSSLPDATQSIGRTGFTYNAGTYLFTNNTLLTIPVSVNYVLSLNVTSGGYSAVGLTILGTTTYYGGIYNMNNAVSNTCNILVPPQATVGLYYMDNTTTLIQTGTRFTLTSLQTGQQGPTGTTGTTGPTGPSIWSATGSNAPYNTVITYSQGYVGVGSSGTYLQTTSGGATPGIGSTVPQYHLDVAGTVRSSAHLFADNSAMVSATPALDYNTFGQNWIANSLPSANWQATAVSASGQYQSAAGSGTGIYYSSNYGQTWTVSSSSTPGNITTIAMSASGQYQVATVYNGGIYYSSNYGVTWATSNASTFLWWGVTMSASGQYASACSTTGGTVPYYSMNYGVTWVASSSVSGSYQAIACSASGQYQVAAILSGGIYYSSNYGQNWTISNISSVGTVQGGAISASGQYATIVTNANGIFISSNYGLTWTQITAVIGSLNLLRVSVSASGQYQVANAYGTGIYYSTNYGASWVQGSASALNWYGSGMSANGQYCLASASGGLVYQSVTRFPPLSITSQSTTTSTALNILAPNIATTNNVGIILGQSATANNYATIGFQYIGAGSTTNYLYLGTTATTLCITAAGNVGIGITNPGYALDVATLGTTGGIQIRNGSGNAAIGTSAYPQIIMGYNGTSNNAHWIATRHNGGTGAGNAIDFYMWTAGQSGSTLGSTLMMSVTSLGVGIGITNPATKLDTSGIIRALDATYVSVASGSGVEIYYSSGGNIVSGTRTSGSLTTAGLAYQASTHTFYVGASGGTTALTINSTGVNVAGSLTVNTYILNYNSTYTTLSLASGLPASLAAGANNNIYIGYNAGLLTTTGAYNVYLGAYAGHETRAGYQNTFVGGQAGYQVTSGINNSYFGFYAGANSTTGSYNTMIGSYTGFGGATTGSNNTFCGHYSGYPNTSGANNTYIGFYAGSTTTTGSSNVYIGSSAVGSAAANTNEIVIGSSVTGAGSNTIKLGNSSSTTIYIPPSIQPISGTLLLNGNVGIGTASPYSQLSLHAAYTASGLFPTSAITWSTTNGTPWQLGSITGYVAAGSGGSTGNLPGGLAFATKAADNSYSSSLTTRMVLDAGGNLGIGTTTPGGPLHVYSTNATSIIVGNSINSTSLQLAAAFNAGDYSSWAAAGDSVIRATGTSNLILQCGAGTGAIYIKNNNNVGIGTTNPAQPLSLNGTQAIYGITNQSENTTSGQLLLYNNSDSYAYPAITFFNYLHDNSAILFDVIFRTNWTNCHNSVGWSIYKVSGNLLFQYLPANVAGTQGGMTTLMTLSTTGVSVNGRISVSGISASGIIGFAPGNITGYNDWPIANYGFALGWNKSGGNGETDFCNNGQGGTGGFQFFNCNSGTTTLYTLATINSSGTYTPSDETIKMDIKPINTVKSLQCILSLIPKNYKVINDIEKRNQIGLIAQEVKEINPHCIYENVYTTEEKEDASGNKINISIKKLSINYQDIFIHLIGSVQEQQKIITDLNKQLIALSNQVNVLTSHTFN